MVNACCADAEFRVLFPNDFEKLSQWCVTDNVVHCSLRAADVKLPGKRTGKKEIQLRPSDGHVFNRGTECRKRNENALVTTTL